MTQYRRARSTGGTYFFTVALADRRSALLVDRVSSLRNAFRHVQRVHPFAIEAIVILPDHLHSVWRLPPSDADYSTRWRLIKTEFSRVIPADELRNASRIAKNERGIWQRRYWEHLIRDDTDFVRHVDYIHNNPARHGHVKRLADWPLSSFHKFVQLGILPHDWGGGTESTEQFGESSGI